MEMPRKRELLVAALAAGFGGFVQPSRGAAETAPARGLVAHWTFDEGRGDVLHDVSGNGHDGRINGAVWAPSPGGHALRFDGVDDYVDCGNTDSLQVRGDLTLTARVLAEDASGRNRLIFGDSASLTINRNYSLRIDLGKLRFEYGDGCQGKSGLMGTAAILGDQPFPTGSWQFLAVVLEGPRYFVYQNGRIILDGHVATPITPTPGSNRRIGGWFAGWFKGDIDEVRLYRRALSSREIMELSGPPPADALPVKVMPRPKPSHQELFCEVLALAHCPAGAKAEFTVRDLASGRHIAQTAAQMEETRSGSGRRHGTARISTTQWSSGNYEVTARVCDASGTVIGRGSATVSHSAEKPAWLGSTEGLDDQVLPPFTALEFSTTAQGCTVSPWGRLYAFDATPFVTQIVSQDAPMLAEPMRLLARVEGVDTSWRPAPSRLTETSDSACRISQEVLGDRLIARVTATVEVDGLAKIALALKSARAVTVEQLVVEIPLRAEHARYLYTWPNVVSGALDADYASAFQSLIWLGDEMRGVQWVCESERNWSVADSGNAIEIARQGEAVVLRLNLVTDAVRLPRGGTLDYVFGLQASPVKPVVSDCWDLRIVNSGVYGNELDLPDKQVNGKPALQDYAEKGARAIMVWRMWDAFGYPLPIGQEERFRRLVSECHRYGLKVIPYVGGFLLSEEAPEARAFGDEMRVHPSEPYRETAKPRVAERWRGWKPQNCIFACQNGPWQDFLADGIDRLIDEYDVDGVYLDTTTLPFPCRNELHGCGFTRPDGSRGSAYPVFAVRDNLRRIHNVVKKRKPDGIVHVHVYDCMNLPGLAWATSYWNGEQLSKQDLQVDALPLDRFRTEFMGCNWGVPADLLNYKLGGYRASTALALLHDVPVRNLATAMAPLWHVRDEFGVKQSRWLPYWSNGDVVHVTPAGCHASLFVHPDGRVLAYVSNLGKEATEVSVSLDLAKLGLKTEAQAKAWRTGALVEVRDGVITLRIPSQDYRMVWIE